MSAGAENGSVLLVRLAIGGFVLFGGLMLLRFNHLYCRDFSIFGQLLDLGKRRLILVAVLVAVPVSMFVSHSLGLLLFALIAFNAIAREMHRSLAIAAHDYRTARTLFGRVSGAFGWSRSARVASGADPLEFGFGMLMLMSAVLGVFLSVSLGAIGFG